MLHSKTVVAITVALTTLLASPVAHALDLAAVGVLNFPGNSSEPEFNADSLLGVGFGALATVGLAPMIGLQVGAVYAQTKYEAGTETLTSNSLNFPVAIRVSPIDMLSIGVGGFYSTIVGDLIVKNGGTETSSIPTVRGNLGLLGSVAVKFPIAPLISLLGDARYQFGLKDMHASDTSSQKTRDLQFLVGVNFGI